jgi:hypothetical protein
VTVLPETVHFDAVPEVNVTAFPEAPPVAASEVVPAFMDLFGKLGNEIVCGVLFTNPVGTSVEEITFASAGEPVDPIVGARALLEESTKNDAPWSVARSNWVVAIGVISLRDGVKLLE